MATEKYEVLVEIGIDSKVVKDSIANADRLTAEITKLREAQKASGIQDAETTAAIKALTQERSRDLRVIQQANSLASETVKGQERLKAELSLLTVQYNNLTTAEQKTTESGQKMGARIRAISDELKDNESAVGNNTRNVGNYKEALSGMLGSLTGMIPALKGVKIGQLGVNTAMNANPVGVVVQLFTGLVSIFKSNAGVADQLTFAMEAVNKTFSVLIDMVVDSDIGKAIGKIFSDPVQGIKDLGNLILENIINRFKSVGVIIQAVLKRDMKALGNGLVQLGTGVENASEKIGGLGASLSNAAKEGYDAAKALDGLVIANAKTAASIKANDIQVQALTKSLKDRTKTEQERIAIANKIADTEIANAELSRKLAVDILAAETMKLKGREKSAEDTAKLIELESNVLAAETEKQIANSQRQTRINILLDKESKEAAKDKVDTSIAEAEREAERLKQIADEFTRSRMSENDRQLLEIDERATELRAAGVKEVEINKWINDEIAKIEAAAKSEKMAKDAEAFANEVELLGLQEQLEIQAAESSIKTEQELADAKGRIALDYLAKKLAIMQEQAWLDDVLTEQEIANLKLVEGEIKRITEGLANPETKPPTLGQMLGLSEQDIEDIQLGLEVVNGLLSAALAATQAASENKIAQIENETKAEIDSINQSTLSEADKKKKITALEKKAAQEKYRIEVEQFNIAKGLQIAMAVANTATAVMAQLSNPTPYAGFVLAALAAVTGGIQIGIIASQQPPPPPQFKRGGLLRGDSHANGGIPISLANGGMIEAEDKEIILTKGVYEDPVLRNEASRLNVLAGGVPIPNTTFERGGLVRKFAAGGIASVSGNQIRQNEHTAMMVAEMSMSQPVLVIEEFQSVQGRQVRTEQNLQL